MPITIGNNIASLVAQRRLNEASVGLSQTMERLSSGLRINHAGDDAAGIAIASKLKADSKVYAQGIRNINDGVSLLNIAEGALNALSDISLRQRELATQAANGTFSLVQRRALNTEANQLVEEYNRIVGSTTFNGMTIFANDPQAMSLQAGVGITGVLPLTVGQSLDRNVGDGTFDPVQAYDGGNQPYGMAVGDFNGDGKCDVVTTGWANTLNILINNGDGSFKAPSTYNTVGIGSISVSVADLNGDGKLDLISADSIDNRVSVLLGNGNGTFGLAQTFQAGAGVSTVLPGDVNGDGRVDIVTIDASDNTVSVLIGCGNGSFMARQTYTIGLFSQYGALSDLNSDGKLDIITADGGDNKLSILYGKGDGTFQAKQSLQLTGPPIQVAVGDLDGNGVADIAVANPTDGTIDIFLGNGNGTWQAQRKFATLGSAFGVTIADINGDGRSDLAISDAVGMSTLIGNGNGTFKAAQGNATTVSPYDVLVADINGDDRPDLLGVSMDGGANDLVNIALANGPTTSTTPYLNICTRQGALDAMSVIDGTLSRIQGEYSVIGASLSRCNIVLSTLASRRENFEAAAARITDADIAEESANMVRLQILQQVAQAILAQANQEPVIALTLLKGTA